MKVDVVGVGLPVEDEAQRRLGGHGDAVRREQAEHRLLRRRLGGDAHGGEDGDVLAEDAVDAGEAGPHRVLAEAGEHRVEGLGVATGAGERVRVQAVAGRVVGALGHGPGVGVDGELEAAGLQALEADAGEAAQVGA